MTLALYGYDSCPYCRRVQAAIEDLELSVELRDTQVDPAHRKALVAQMGRPTVPVLRISGEDDGDDRWLPESAAIVAYLYETYGDGRKPPSVDSLVIQRVSTAVMWSLLIAGMFFVELQVPLWASACAIGTARSVYNGIRTKSLLHFGIGAIFALATIAIGLRAFGITDVPWWYAIYTMLGLILVAALVARVRRRSGE